MEKYVADCEYSGNSSKTGEFNQTMYITCFFLKREKNYAHFDNTRWQNLHDVYMSWWTKKAEYYLQFEMKLGAFDVAASI